MTLKNVLVLSASMVMCRVSDTEGAQAESPRDLITTKRPAELPSWTPVTITPCTSEGS
jgi:hypothetical protein